MHKPTRSIVFVMAVLSLNTDALKLNLKLFTERSSKKRPGLRCNRIFNVYTPFVDFLFPLLGSAFLNKYKSPQRAEIPKVFKDVGNVLG